MSNDINLVSSKTFQFEQELKRLKTLKIIAIGFLAMVALVSVLLFVAIFALPTSSVKKEQEQALSNISSLSEKFFKYSLIGDRLNSIAGIIKSRKNYSLLINTVLSKLPADLSVDTMTIDNGTFILIVSGGSLTPMDNFIEDVVILGNKENIIKNLSIQSLVVNTGSGKYTLTLQADTL
nr:hypothetical protein [Candidatus Levybacteria bacterium]